MTICLVTDRRRLAAAAATEAERRACLLAQARYAVAAGDDARGKFANVDAAIFYERALAAAAELTPDPAATAAVAETLGDALELTAFLSLPDGTQPLRASQWGDAAAPDALGEALAGVLVGQGADRLLAASIP